MAVPFVAAILLAMRLDSGPIRTAADATHPGFALRDATAEAGIRFVHQRPSFDPKIANVEPHVAALGAAVSVADFDGDGWPDLYFTNSRFGEPNALYRNKRDGTFEDVAAARGARRPQSARRGRLDGRRLGRHRQRRPRGRARLPLRLPLAVPKRRRPPLRGRHRARRPASLGEQQRRDLARLRPRRAARSLRHRLLPRHRSVAPARRRGSCTRASSSPTTAGRTCSSATSAAGGSRTSPTGWASAARAGRSPPRRPTSTATAGPTSTSPTTTVRRSSTSTNEGKRFTLATAGLESESKSGMSVTLGDAFNRGRLDAFVTNISERGYIFQNNNLRLNELRESRRFRNVAEGAVADAGWAWGAQFGDLEQRRLQRAVRRQRLHLGRPQRRATGTRCRRSPARTARFFEDASTWPAFGNASLSGYERSRVYLNRGVAGWVDVADRVGVNDLYDGRAVALADLSNRGAVDVDRREPEPAGGPVPQPARLQPTTGSPSSSSARAATAARSAPK